MSIDEYMTLIHSTARRVVNLMVFNRIKEPTFDITECLSMGGWIIS